MAEHPISIIPKLIGHEQAEIQFLRQYKSNRLPHAFLITGQKGIGKCGFAVRMARFLLSGGQFESNDMFGGETLDFDGYSPLVKQLISNAYPDFTYLHLGMESLSPPYKTMNVISVEHIRGATDLTHQTIASGSARVIVIDDAHTMNRQAENALLKTLEEPSENTYIILCTNQPNSLLPTIRSRCCTYNLKPISNEKITEYLNNKQTKLTQTELTAYAKLANGSIGIVDDLIENEALNLYSVMVDAVKNGADSVYTLINAITTIKNKHNFELFKMLFDNFAYRCFKAETTGGIFDKIIEDEEKAFEKIKSQNNGVKMVDWINQTKEKINQTGAPVYLDLKSVILTVFLPLHENK